MSIGFHLDDIEEEYFNKRYGYKSKRIPPIGAPFHDNEDYQNEEHIPPIGAPFHDNG